MFQAAADSEFPSQIEDAAAVLIDAFQNGKKLLIFGNGGSASDAQHLAGELVVRFKASRRALPAIALGSDTAVLTACGNDLCFEDLFSRQIEALGNSGDVSLGITTSGNSKNVVRGLETSRRLGMVNILLTGEDGGEARALCDFAICAPADTTARIQELHIAAYHSLCEIVESSFLEKLV